MAFLRCVENKHEWELQWIIIFMCKTNYVEQYYLNHLKNVCAAWGWGEKKFILDMYFAFMSFAFMKGHIWTLHISHLYIYGD